MENLELAKLVLKQIDNEPSSFDMRTWGEKSGCGTTACIAGWAMIFSGYQIKNSEYISPDNDYIASYEDEGRKLLGLTGEEFSTPEGDLFYLPGATALRNLRRLIANEEARREKDS